jgi:cell division protein FtsQ
MTAASTTYRRMPRANADRAANVRPIEVGITQALAQALAVAGVLLVLAATASWAVRQPVFTLQGIQVEGDLVRSSVAQVRAAAVPRLEGNFFTLDLRAAQKAFESVPWVRTAQVRRVWPDRLQVTLEEHRAAALWGGSDGEHLVNTHGELFEANAASVDDQDLPSLSGPDGSAARVLGLYRSLALALAPLGSTLEALTLTSRGSWTARLANGVTLELGRGDDGEVLERTRRFVATVPEMVARFGRPLAHADLRHRDGYALKLTGLGTGPESGFPTLRAPAARAAAAPPR